MRPAPLQLHCHQILKLIASRDDPAVAPGLAVMKLVKFADSWIHIVADLVGALCAGLAFKFLNPADQ